MRSAKVAAITAALVLVPVVAVHASSAHPAGPTFSCRPMPWGTLGSAATHVVAITPTSVTTTDFRGNTIQVWTIAPNNRMTPTGVAGIDTREPILDAADLAAHPNIAASSFAGGKGMFVRRSYENTGLFGIWACTY